MPTRSETVWYLIKPAAHEGPYSFELLEAKYLAQEITLDAKIWARGWPDSVEFKKLKELYEAEVTVLNFEEQYRPEVEALEADAEKDDAVKDHEVEAPRFPRKSFTRNLLILTGFIGLVALVVPLATLNRLPQLDRPQSLGLSEFREVKILFDNTSLRVPLPRLINSLDFKKISLVDRSPQNCSYTVSFISDEHENLSQQKIAFSSQAHSSQHWVSFDRFEFREGQRLIPGHYEVTLMRTHCSALGWRRIVEAKDPDYQISFKQSFYSTSLEDLNKSLTLLKKKKERELKRAELAAYDTWREIIEKLRTLSALSQQISIDFQLLLNRKYSWDERVKKTLNTYTIRYGSFLTEFIENNSKDFDRIANIEMPMKRELLASSPRIVGFAQRIGILSSEVLEKIKGKVPQRVDLEKWLTDFDSSLKLEVNKMKLSIQEIELILASEKASEEEVPSLSSPQTQTVE